MKTFNDFLARDFPEGNRADSLVMTGFNMAQTLVQVLKQCGDNLTRENVMKQAANLKDFRTTNLLPGITINTSPIDFAPIKQRNRGLALALRAAGGHSPLTGLLPASASKGRLPRKLSASCRVQRSLPVPKM